MSEDRSDSKIENSKEDQEDQPQQNEVPKDEKVIIAEKISDLEAKIKSFTELHTIR